MPLPQIDEYPHRQQYRFCPLCGGPLIRRVEDHQPRLYCERDNWTHYPIANLASTVLIEHPDGIVLLKRGIPPDAGIWHLPIGHVEFGETPREAAIRETEEETGLQLGDVVFLDMHFGPSYSDPLDFYLIFCYRAVVVGGTLTIDAENEAAQVFPADAVPPLKWTSHRRTLAAWRAWKAVNRGNRIGRSRTLDGVADPAYAEIHRHDLVRNSPMSTSTFRWPVLAGLFASLLAVGCGGGDAPVKGSVVYEGKAIEYGKGQTITLSFVSKQGMPPKTYRAMLDPQSQFAVVNPDSSGIRPGAYRITAVMTGPAAPKQAEFNKRYDVNSTPLEVTVPAGGFKALKIDLDAGTVSP